ncbi:MAG: hypothetical protein JO028_09955, partial [Acidobacteriaceae bacterium]|nr:hypothetical protein [Acidobacteriaceae bacterium]
MAEEQEAENGDVAVNTQTEAADDNPSWSRVQLARHPKRPHSRDYIESIFTNFEELHGDRFFGDDHS